MIFPVPMKKKAAFLLKAAFFYQPERGDYKFLFSKATFSFICEYGILDMRSTLL